MTEKPKERHSADQPPIVDAGTIHTAASDIRHDIEVNLVPLTALVNSIANVLNAIPPDSTDKFAQVMSNSEVRRLIDWELPPIDDVSETLDLHQGTVSAIRMDQLGNGVGLKKPVVAGLIVRKLMSKINRPDKIYASKGFIDGGSVNTGLAMGYYAQKYGMENMLVTSHVMSQEVMNYILERSGGRLNIVRDEPTEDLSPEFGLTKHFMEEAKQHPEYMPLFHSLHSWEALRPLGEEIAKEMDDVPDYIVLSIGAGATLGGLAVPIKEQMRNTPTIVVNEHVLCPLVDKPEITLTHEYDFSGYDTNWIPEPPSGKRTMIVGPHEEDLTQCLDSKVFNQIGNVARYEDSTWKQMASHCKTKGLSVGNSSAANLCIAKALAEEKGAKVLTVIVEPLRDFYLK